MRRQDRLRIPAFRLALGRALALQFFQHFIAEFIAVAVSKRDVTR